MKLFPNLLFIIISSVGSHGAWACKRPARGGSAAFFQSVITQAAVDLGKDDSIVRIEKSSTNYNVRAMGPVGCKEFVYEAIGKPNCKVTSIKKSEKTCD